MAWWGVALALASAVAAAGPALAVPDRRVALVIGNGRYDVFRRLPNAARDAVLVAHALDSLGFEVETLLDAPRAGLAAALGRFAHTADGADVALLFYAGHGVQVGGENYLIPTDATLADAGRLDAEAMDLPHVVHAADGAKLRLVFLDACRDNPLPGQVPSQSAGQRAGQEARRGPGSAAARPLERGLAPVSAANLGFVTGLGTLLSYSTAPGMTALDGVGQNGPFAIALAHHLPEPGLEIGQVMQLVRKDVYEMTRGRQVPWDNSSLTTPVVLRPRAGTGGGAAAGPQVSEGNGRIDFTVPDGRRVTIGRDVLIGPNVRVFGAPVAIAPPTAPPAAPP